MINGRDYLVKFGQTTPESNHNYTKIDNKNYIGESIKISHRPIILEKWPNQDKTNFYNINFRKHVQHKEILLMHIS